MTPNLRLAIMKVKSPIKTIENWFESVDHDTKMLCAFATIICIATLMSLAIVWGFLIVIG